jgi:hypothetical protein
MSALVAGYASKETVREPKRAREGVRQKTVWGHWLSLQRRHSRHLGVPRRVCLVLAQRINSGLRRAP